MSYFNRIVDRTLGSDNRNLTAAVTANQIQEQFEIKKSKTDLPTKLQNKSTNIKNTFQHDEKNQNKTLPEISTKIQEMKEYEIPKYNAETKTKENNDLPKTDIHSTKLQTKSANIKNTFQHDEKNQNKTLPEIPTKIQEMKEYEIPKYNAETKTKENNDLPKTDIHSTKDPNQIEDEDTSLVEPSIRIQSSKKISNTHFVKPASKSAETKHTIAESADDFQISTSQNLASHDFQSNVSAISKQKTKTDDTVFDSESDKISENPSQSIIEHTIETKEIQPRENQKHDDNTITFPAMMPRDPKKILERQPVTQETVVTINIGRIEVRASEPDNSTSSPPTKFTPPLSLTEYLKLRKGDKK